MQQAMNIGGLLLDVKATGLNEKIALINKATELYLQADTLIEKATQVNVEITIASEG